MNKITHYHTVSDLRCHRCGCRFEQQLQIGDYPFCPDCGSQDIRDSSPLECKNFTIRIQGGPSGESQLCLSCTECSTIGAFTPGSSGADIAQWVADHVASAQHTAAVGQHQHTITHF